MKNLPYAVAGAVDMWISGLALYCPTSQVRRGHLSTYQPLQLLAEKQLSLPLSRPAPKLLLIARSRRPAQVGSVLPETDKSFLVLFFKKEHLPFAGLDVRPAF